jgi:hypothetical protein
MFLKQRKYGMILSEIKIAKEMLAEVERRAVHIILLN